MIGTNGMRLSLAGGLAVVIGAIALFFLPDTLPAVLMMAGGLAVIGGFVWSLAHFYIDPATPDDTP